jgi:hypothetical protein
MAVIFNNLARNRDAGGVRLYKQAKKQSVRNNDKQNSTCTEQDI